MNFAKEFGRRGGVDTGGLAHASAAGALVGKLDPASVATALGPTGPVLREYVGMEIDDGRR